MIASESRGRRVGMPARLAGRLSAADRTRYLKYLLLVVVVLSLPQLVRGYNLYLATLVLLAIMGAVALNLLTGNAGQVSLGNAAFIAMGSFGVAVGTHRANLPFVVLVPLATIAAGVVGAAVGLPALRLRGLYLLLATLGVHYIFFFFANLYQTRQVGPSGFAIPLPDIFGWSPATRADWYMLAAFACLASLFVADSMLRSRPGRAWAVIRHKEPVATALGVPVVRYKVLAFVVSSMILGLQGSVYAYFIGNITVDLWDLNSAIGYVAMIVLGGLGSVSGSVIGAAIITVLPYLLANYLSTTPGIPRILSTHPGFITTFLYGLVITVMLLVAPRGVSGFLGNALLTARRLLGQAIERRAGG